MGRKDLAMKQRRKFTVEFKRQVAEEFLSGVSSAAQLMRRHDISSGLLYRWKDLYTQGRFEDPPRQETALEERIRQLEQLVGKLALENEFLKKAIQRGLLSPTKRSGGSSLSIVPSSKAPKGGAS
jgi:transposase-like protein